MDDKLRTPSDSVLEADEVSRFADSYASFTRIINSLQRQYIELQDEFVSQHEELAEANRKLVEVTEQNLEVTEFLDSILNSISAGVVAVDREGRVTHFNRAASRILGVPPGEPLGSSYRECIPPGSPVEANALRTAERAATVDSVERVIECVDGTRLYLSVSTTVLRDSEGRPTGAVEVFHDLTKIKKLEKELARLNTLAALGEMAATIAHEVRNPLSGIGGFAALLQKDLDPDDPKYKLVSNIIRGVNSLNDTVTTLLNYTRFEETNKTEVTVEKFLADAVAQFRRENPDKAAGVEFRLLPAPSDNGAAPSADLDPLLMRQVFFNLFTNAIDAVGDRGVVEVGCRTLARQAAMAHHADRLLLGLDETVLETVVADSGPGIAEENLDKIFSPFFTTRTSGNGLGLAVAWKILKAHGGDITAENRPTGGALFRLLLPVKLHPAKREHQA